MSEKELNDIDTQLSNKIREEHYMFLNDILRQLEVDTAKIRQKNYEEERTMTELDKLEELLKAEGIQYERIDEFPYITPLNSKPGYGERHQICVPSRQAKEWDAICQYGSYGFEGGLLEIMGDCLLTYEELQCDNVLGYMTAEEVMNRVYDREKIAKGKREYEDNLDWWKSLSVKTQNDIINHYRRFMREEEKE